MQRHLKQPEGVPVTSDSLRRLQQALESQIVAAGAAGVLTFNGRSGAVGLTAADVNTALGYVPASSSGGWTVHGSTTIAAPTTAVDFTGLAGANEIMIICDGITMSGSDVPVVRVRTSGGSFYTTSGDYRRINQSGTPVVATNGGSFWNVAASAARYGTMRILGANLTGIPRLFFASPNDSSPTGFFLANTTDVIDAVRVAPNGATNLTGGTIHVLKC